MTGKVGDAEYLIVRNQKVIYESANEASSRNPGLQRLDPKVNMDVNSVCQINEHQLIKGDIVIAGTAGFFDNVPTIQILEVLQPNYHKLILPEAKISKELKPKYNRAVGGLAKILVNTAERNILKQQNLGHFVRDDMSVFAFTVIRNIAQKRPR
ncbi:hypothetical protein BKA69DRAFT_1108285 [Paraphysoderma sedebokerense]|nr:hypothetical protein BKA69DRAFT_1108285 [Paraphysoderma sedebokerense]